MQTQTRSSTDWHARAQTIQPDGRVSLMLVGEVTAAGKTPPQLAAELTRSYGKFLNDAELTVSLSGSAERQVYVGGEGLARCDQ